MRRAKVPGAGTRGGRDPGNKTDSNEARMVWYCLCAGMGGSIREPITKYWERKHWNPLKSGTTTLLRYYMAVYLETMHGVCTCAIFEDFGTKMDTLCQNNEMHCTSCS